MPTPNRGEINTATSSEMRNPDAALSWGEACAEMINGKKVSRRAWGDEDCVFLHAAFVHIRKGADGSLHVLQVSEGDLLGADWFVVREN